MKLFKLKRKNIILVSLLAIAGFLGISSVAVNTATSKEAPVAEKAEAAALIYFGMWADGADSDAIGGDWVHYNLTLNTGSDNASITVILKQNAQFNFTYKRADYGGNDDIQKATVSTSISGFNGSGGRTISYTASSTIRVTITCSNAWSSACNVSIVTAPYTITFNPNGGSGSTTTRNKNYGSSFSIPSLATLGIGAGAARSVLKWNTASNGSGQDYALGGTIAANTNSDLTLYLIQEWHTYKYSVDGGDTWVDMTRTGDADGYIGEWSPSSDNYLPGGVTPIFKEFDPSGSEVGNVTPTAWEGNQYEYQGNHFINYTTTNKIYMKITGENYHTIFIGGGSSRGITIVHNDYEYKYDSAYKSDTNEYYATVTVYPGDTIKRFDNGTVNTITIENPDTYGMASGGGVSYPGVFTLYLKSNNYVYCDMKAEQTAVLLAQLFNSDLTTVCTSTVSGGATSQITTAYDKHKGYYNHVTTDAQTALKSGSSDANVTAMRTKYNYIIWKYGTSVAENYMGATIVKPAFRDFSPFNLIGGEDNFSTIIIIVSSSVALLSVTALSILVIRKRKSKED